MLSPSEIGTLVEKCTTVFKWLSAVHFVTVKFPKFPIY